MGRNPESPLHAFISDIVASYGRRLKQRIQVGSFEEMCHLIEKGIGIGVVPLSAVQRQVAPGHRGGADRGRLVGAAPEDLRAESDVLPDFVRELVDFLVADAAATA